MRIRRASPEDARAIAEVHVRAWRAVYRGQMPDDYLERLSVDDREAEWREGLARDGRTWVAERDGRLLGFCATGPTGDEDATSRTMEVYAIYLEPDVVGTGVGRQLFAHAVDEIRRSGCPSITLWVLESNRPARRFYERAGWHADGAVSTQRADCANLPTVRYRLDLA